MEWWRRCVPAPEVLLGVEDEVQMVSDFFDAIDWYSRGLDSEKLSAEDFLSALGE